MKNLDRAINFTALSVLTGGSEKTACGFFTRVEEAAGAGVPLVEIPEVCEEITGFSRRETEECWRAVRRAFEKLPPDTVILTPGDPHFPEDVKDTPFLYMRGNTTLAVSSGVSVVGTRTPSGRGRELTRLAVTSLGEAGLTVVSGLALGIDGTAHIEALARGFNTVGVIGTPLTEAYPKQHARLQEAVAENGLLVSRFAPGVSVKRWFFMQRNLLMSQISRASLVVEETDGGGGVSQAKYSEAQGKPVLVFEETYNNRTFLWPRSFEAPVVVKTPGELAGAYLAAGGYGAEAGRKSPAGQGMPARQKKRRPGAGYKDDVQPRLF